MESLLNIEKAIDETMVDWTNHTNKLRRKYRAKGYTLFMRREYRRDQ
jgi:hypothetical protein